MLSRFAYSLTLARTHTFFSLSLSLSRARAHTLTHSLAHVIQEDETIAKRSELNPKSPLSPTPDGPAGEDLHEGTELTAQQEEDIDEVLAGRDWSQNDAEEYSTRLGDQLSKLENENFQSIIASEHEVEMLMEQLDEALSTLDEMEETIVKYNSILGHVKSDVMVVAEQNGIVVTRTENENALLKEVQTLVDFLDFPSALVGAMLYGDLSISATVNQVNEAVTILADKRKQALSPGLELMTSVREKVDQLNQFEEQFANRLVQFFLDHLNEQIKQQSVHEIRRRRLQPYGELMKWLRNCEPRSSFSKFSGLCQVLPSHLVTFFRLYFVFFIFLPPFVLAVPDVASSTWWVIFLFCRAYCSCDCIVGPVRPAGTGARHTPGHYTRSTSGSLRRAASAPRQC